MAQSPIPAPCPSTCRPLPARRPACLPAACLQEFRDVRAQLAQQAATAEQLATAKEAAEAAAQRMKAELAAAQQQITKVSSQASRYQQQEEEIEAYKQQLKQVGAQAEAAGRICGRAVCVGGDWAGYYRGATCAVQPTWEGLCVCGCQREQLDEQLKCLHSTECTACTE